MSVLDIQIENLLYLHRFSMPYNQTMKITLCTAVSIIFVRCIRTKTERQLFCSEMYLNINNFLTENDTSIITEFLMRLNILHKE